MHKISVIIPTFNEEKNLSELLPLLNWADEIMIVDSFSTDSSIDIAKKFGARIEQHIYENSAAQKNRAISWASHEWIFLIDADERPTNELIKEIQQLLNENVISSDAYWIKRDNYFGKKKIKYSGWQNDSVIRFFRKSLCLYENKNVHAEIVCTGKISYLKNSFIHNTYKSFNHFLNKTVKYARWSALDYIDKTKTVGLFHLFLKPFFRFFKHYILKRGFLDGKEGFIISVLMAWGVFLRYLFILEEKKKTT